MKIFTTNQIRLLDAQTIALEPISSLELMNRAAYNLFQRFQSFLLKEDSILVMAGPGNNGGDALAIARLLLEAGYRTEVMLCQPEAKVSNDTLEQLVLLRQTKGAKIHNIAQSEALDSCIGSWDFLLDGLFGSGLNRPLNGYFADVVHWINRQNMHIVSIDLPSGLFGEDNRQNLHSNIVHANLTLGLQFPRLAYLLVENEPYVGKWETVEIGIHEKAIRSLQTPYTYTTPTDLQPLLKKRSKHAHKGNFGKVLLIAGSPEMTGAALLSVKGALRSGAGLVYLHIAQVAAPVIQAAIPECIVYAAERCELSLSEYQGIAIGSGIGEDKHQLAMLEKLLHEKVKHLVLDADALNHLARNPTLLPTLTAGTILTPHPKEFDRLVGSPSKSGFERLEKAIGFAQRHQVFIVLKGAYTACIEPDGTCSFNSSGNPGMATAGSGDVLTGIIVSLLAQDYKPSEACKLGVFLHGFSGDIALKTQSMESMIASDVAENLGLAFKHLNKESGL